MAQARSQIRKVLATSGSDQPHVRGLYLCVPEDDYKRGHYLDFSGLSLPEPGSPCPLLIMGDCKPFEPAKIQPLLKSLEQDTPCQ